MDTVENELDTTLTGFAVLRSLCEMEGLTYETYDNKGRYLIIRAKDGTLYFVGSTFRHPRAETDSYHLGKSTFNTVKNVSEQMGIQPAAGFVIIKPTRRTAEVLVVPIEGLDTTKENDDAVYLTEDGTIRFSLSAESRNRPLPGNTLLRGSLSFHTSINGLS